MTLREQIKQLPVVELGNADLIDRDDVLALLPAEPMTWQPIETFVPDPDDEEKSVLVAVGTDEVVVGEAWQAACGEWFWNGGGDTARPVIGVVTHWMPLPPPPVVPNI